MKKITLLFLVMALLFVACDTGEPGETRGTGETGRTGETNVASSEGTVSADGKTPYEIYLLSAELLADADSMIMDGRISMKMDMGGESMDITMNTLMEMVMHSETDVDMRMIATTVTDSGDMSTAIYFRNGVMYMDMMEMMGMQMKMEMPLEDMLEQVNTSGALDFTEDAIMDASMREVAGGTEISFTLSGEVMSDMVDSLTGGMLANVGLDSSDMSINLGDVEYVVVLDSDNMLTSMDVSMSMSMEVDGERTAMDVSTAMKVVQIGNVVIDFPADLDDYMDMSGMMF